jgi:acyl-CoA thioesterase YciA
LLASIHQDTVAVDGFHFIKPVFLGDVVSIYARVESIGTTSLTISLDIYTERKTGKQIIATKVAEGLFSYVHVDEQGKPAAIYVKDI